MSATITQPGFAACAKRGRTKSFEARVEIAMRRFKAALAKMGGTINVWSRGDMVDFGVKHVHNRDRELGDYKSGEFRRVIVAAVNALLELGRRDTDAGCEHDTDRGLMILNEPIAPRRQHRQKYHPAYQMHRRRRAA